MAVASELASLDSLAEELPFAFGDQRMEVFAMTVPLLFRIVSE